MEEVKVEEEVAREHAKRERAEKPPAIAGLELSEEELARRRRGEAPLPPPPALKPPAERLADHLSREETLADFVADGED